jgi:hypothetical protein
MYYLGVDPDLQATAVAVVNDEGIPVAVYCLKHKGTTGRDAVVSMIDMMGAFMVGDNLPEAEVAAHAVESQEIVYAAKMGRNPRDLALLANISGAFCAMLRLVYSEALALLPAPQKWKGSVPKPVHQARILSDIKWEAKRVGTDNDGYCYPLNTEKLSVIGIEAINKGDWKHVMDAIGLARFAREQHLKSGKFKQRLAAIDTPAPAPAQPIKKKRGRPKGSLS